jgi:probable HAF family extracellular repeat protein
VPGAQYTNATAINNLGQVVGNYGQDTSSDSHGFLYSNGVFTYFDYPGQIVTVPMGINSLGLIVGHAGEAPVFGFLYDGSKFSNIDVGQNSATFSDGINDSGEIVGATGTIYTTKAFEMVNGTVRVVKFPGSYIYAAANAVNNHGRVVGWTDNGGYLYSGGRFESVIFPGAAQTQALGINDKNVIVGWYNLGTSSYYAFILINHKYISFSYPGAIGTFASGINAAGQIVGSYTFDFQSYHGFLATPVLASDQAP